LAAVGHLARRVGLRLKRWGNGASPIFDPTLAVHCAFELRSINGPISTVGVLLSARNFPVPGGFHYAAPIQPEDAANLRP
jgi:hypothetical protein